MLLITSRGTRRWVIPKGNHMAGIDPHQAAAVEAFEEAGISGLLCPTALGHFAYDKRRGDGSLREIEVAVYPLAVTEELASWPEDQQRLRQWFSLDEAVAAVDEPDLKAIIGAFRNPPRFAGVTDRALLWVREAGANRYPMLKWFQALMPKQGRFFELFDEHAAILVAGADALARLLQGGSGIAEHSKTIFDRENEGRQHHAAGAAGCPPGVRDAVRP